MVCTANELSEWKDFPKGLKVLLLDEDSSSAAEIKSKLEAMDYIVSTFCNENEALSAISSKPGSFHIAIVEVSTSDIDGSFKFLETAKELPTIMTSNIHCLNTMMKCVALGAVEFLQKPLSEDKLRNIWQHVVHKAFSAGESVMSDSLNSVKDSVVSTLQLKVKIEETKDMEIDTSENMSLDDDSNCEQSSGSSDKYPAPSTPQLKQGARSLDDGECQDITTCSTEKEGGEQEEDCQFVETTNMVVDEILQEDHHQSSSETVIKKEDGLADGFNTGTNTDEQQSKESTKNSNGGAENPSKASGLNKSCGTRASRKKMKVDWTPDLHKNFVKAVEQLGVDQAIPSRILELMKVEGLTRHNVASHLQKYRMHKRHILPKEDVQRWPQQRDQIPRSYYPHKPIIAYPPYHLNHSFPPSPVYPMWGATNAHVAGAHMWGPPPNYPPWPPAESWHWKPHPGMYADAWGCPVIPQPQTYHTLPQNTSGFESPGMFDNSPGVPQKSLDLHPADDEIDKIVKEAISKPWLPLPLGLKPPSTDCVLAELSRQGISTVPPQSHTTQHSLVPSHDLLTGTL